MSRWEAARRYLPSLLRASVVTLVLSCLSMALAVALGVLIATGRVYGGRLARLALTGYVELMRGTPILLQLFVLYYGLAAAIRLPAFVAALLGLALNYAAYESEIYRRRSRRSRPASSKRRGRSGFSERQVLTLVRGPQAFRLALAPMTNDFVALLKDSSLVSVLTVVELTKQTQIFATNLGSWVIPGTLCAALYLAMSLPLVGAGAAARAAMEGADGMSDVVLRVARPAPAPRRAPVLAGVTLDVARGELVALMGPSGSGKTTILRAIAGLEPFRRRHGSTSTASRSPAAPPIRRRRCAQLRRKVGMVFQFHCLFEHLSALDNVCLAPVHVHGVAPRGRASARAASCCAAFGVEHRAGALPRELSGGEAQRVAIARALAVDPPLLLMDEPTASLDPARRAELGALLQGLQRQQPHAAHRRRTTRTSRATSRRASCGCATAGRRDALKRYPAERSRPQLECSGSAWFFVSLVCSVAASASELLRGSCSSRFCSFLLAARSGAARVERDDVAAQARRGRRRTCGRRAGRAARRRSRRPADTRRARSACRCRSRCWRDRGVRRRARRAPRDSARACR